MANCSFCGSSNIVVDKLFMADEDVAICSRCVEFCASVGESGGVVSLDASHGNGKQCNHKDKIIDPIDLKAHLDQYIISQDDAKVTLSVAVANHYKRSISDSYLDKSNVIITGPTGSGKTLIAKVIAEYLNVPFVIIDVTCLTEAGYVGDDVETILVRLLQAAGGDVEAAQRGIVFLDEVDKIAKRSSASGARDISGEGVQQALLKIVEGAEYSVPLSKKSERYVEIDTSDILFIASGAFVGLNDIKKKQSGEARIGFSSKQTLTTNGTEFQALVEFGMIPEFVGRFPVVTEVSELNHADMVHILTDVKHNLVCQYKELFKLNELALEFDKEAINEIARAALKQKTGARGLKAIIEKTLLAHMFNASKYQRENRLNIVISPAEVTKPSKVEFRADL